MQKKDYTIDKITRSEFVKLCNLYDCELNFLRKNNNQESYEVRLKIIKLDKSCIEKLSIKSIFENSFEYISKDNANLAEIASYIKMRRASQCLKKKLKEIDFETEIKESEKQLSQEISALEKRLDSLKEEKRRLKISNHLVIDNIQKFIN